MFLLILSVYSLDNLDGIFNPFLNENGSLILYSSAFSLLQDLSGLSGGMKDDKNTTGDKELSFWRRLSYSIGYSGGICWTGSDLRKYTDWTLDPIELISANLYYLNSIELSVIYPFNNEKGIEVGAGYGWARIKGTNGWFKVIYTEDDTIRLHGWYSANLSSLTFSISRWSKHSHFRPYFGIPMVIAKGSENRGEDWFAVKRLSIGIILGISVSSLTWIEKDLSLSSFISFRLSLLREIWNNSPWDEYWDKPLSVSLGGLYGGIKLNFGGVK